LTDTFQNYCAALQPIRDRSEALHPITDRYEALQPITDRYEALQPITDRYEALQPITDRSDSGAKPIQTFSSAGKLSIFPGLTFQNHNTCHFHVSCCFLTQSENILFY